MKNNQLRIFVLIGIMASLSIILQRISIPIIPGINYLKLELSSIPIITIAIFYGLRYGFLTALIVNFIDSLFSVSVTGFPLDQAVNVIAIVLFMIIIRYYFLKKQYLLGLVIAITFNTIALTLLNYFIITPLYFSLANMNLPDAFLLWTIKIYGTFNFIKWGLVGVTYVFIYQRYLIWLNK